MRTRLALTLATLVLAGCSSPAKQAPPEVATLESPGSAPPSAASPAAPVIRPDSTAAEVFRMQQPWFRCLKGHDVPTRVVEGGLLDLDASGTVNGRIRSAEPDMEKACGGLRPVLAPELDEDRNPYWADDDENYHKCLVEAGYDFVKKDGEWVPGPSWYTDSKPPNESVELGCQAKAFDGRKG
ncbi:hypothetical protein [Actinoplanes xinjiangensis]|uniref:Lipoprotein n=1 Tax=Actinoplanes xinjiangensis TaxID=512350 RepID=A0A316FUN9_9ACTN|nr:hypothetical protein [Actinoplanes xinjiangensis]PWK52133.1 hypothetical protein BC793_101142 [Actinoplanes xinjiangensis]GIF37161.1 hypothetical protein Axi01nite_14720 [Actinoplanes xinjiangensis]